MEHCQNYCLVCENRYYSSNVFICGLTDKIEIFEDECDSFILDDHQLYRKRKPIVSEMKYRYPTNILGKFLSNKSYKKGKKIHLFTHYKSKGDTKDLLFKEFDFDIRSSYLSILVLLALVIAMGYKDKQENGLFFFIAFIAVLILGVSYIVYNVYFNKNKKYILIEDKRLVYNDETIFWNDIFDYGFLKQENRTSLVVQTMSKGIVELGISDIDVKENQLAEIIELNKKKHLFTY